MVGILGGGGGPGGLSGGGLGAVGSRGWLAGFPHNLEYLEK